MTDEIKISPKHGVNPALWKCFFCHKEKGVVLMGRLKDDAKAPPDVLLDYDPCDECIKLFKQGVLFIEVAYKPLQEGQPPIQDDVYPTGRWAVMNPDIRERMDLPKDEATFLVEEQIAKALGMHDHD